jgi:hypothetical protein
VGDAIKSASKVLDRTLVVRHGLYGSHAGCLQPGSQGAAADRRYCAGVATRNHSSGADEGS